MRNICLFNVALLLVAVLFVQDSRAQDTLEGHTTEIYSVAFSPDGTILTSASDDNTVKLWDVSEWTRPITADAFGGSDDRFDLDGNGAVDLADFFLFADHFGQPARAKLLVMAQELIGLPDDVQLHQNVPNPFNRQTLISFLMRAPGPARVELFALTGQRVAVLSQGFRRAGSHRLHWDGRDDDDRPLASGTYLYRLVTTDGTVTRKLTLLR